VARSRVKRSRSHIRYAQCAHRQERVGASCARGFIDRHLRRASCDQRPARQSVQAQVAPSRGGPALQRCGEWLATRLGTEPACTEAAECRTRDSKHALQANTCRHLLQRTSAVTALDCTASAPPRWASLDRRRLRRVQAKGCCNWLGFGLTTDFCDYEISRCTKCSAQSLQQLLSKHMTVYLLFRVEVFYNF